MKRLLTLLLLTCGLTTGLWASSIPGALSGRFTINASGEKVLFSKGNLQYVDENYQFAEHQYDYFGDNQYSNHVDMFAKNGYSSPDGDTAWRILSQSEWSYLYTERSVTNTLSEGARYSKATIGGTYKGVIVFPDSYTHPNGTGFAGNCNNAAENYASTVSLEGWALMEAAGCVFLPAAGYKNDNIRQVDDASVYDSSTANGDKSRCTPGFYSNEIKLDDKSYNTTCVPVRLVKDYQLQQDAEGYYLLGSLSDWQDFAEIVNSGTNPAANAKMTADIDLGDDQTMISDNVSYRYSGVFDGQGHKLNVNYYSSETTVDGGYYIAPFRDIQGATIKNLTVTGNITGYMHCAGVAGVAFSPSTNLISNVTVSANITILNTHGGGFIGHNEYATTTIQDCLFNGTINGKSGGSTVGVFFGWSEKATMSLINCLENGSYTNCSTFTPTSCPGYAVPTVTNCYYAVSGSYPGTHATSAQLSDGTIAYKLQNNRGDLVWGQRIGTDAEPVLTNDENYRVYRGKNDYTNSPEEAYEGIQQDGEGNYLLGCLSDWQDFAALVQTTPTANARMTADFDLGDDQTHIGYSSSSRYCGVFDGDGHTLTVNYNSSEYGLAPFRYTAGATIKNLHIDGSIISTYSPESHTSGVISHSRGADFISNVWVSVDIQSGGSGWIECAAFIGCNNSGNSTITDCLFTGSMKTTSGYYNGCFFGYSDSGNVTVSNCLSTGTFDYYGGSTYVESHGGVFSNCYVRQFPSSIPTAMQVTNDGLADGTIATALQNNREETVWVQDPLTNQPMLALFAGKYTVPASGLGTFSAKAKFALPEGLEAYYCKNYDATEGAIGVTAIEGVVPAEIGVLLRGEPGETYTLTISDDTPATVTDNALVAVTTQTKIDQTSGDYTNFGLSNGTFKKVNSAGGTVKANRAYLHILTSALTQEATARGIKLVWDKDVVTGVNDVRSKTEDVRGDNDSWFTLSGLRLNSKPTTKGIYIVNGKKIFIN